MAIKILKHRASKKEAFDFIASLESANKFNIKIKPTTDFEPPNKLNYTEGVAQSAIIDYLTVMMSLGKLFFQRINNTPIWDNDRYRAMPKGTMKGFPDIFVLMNKRCVFFEVKSSKGKQSEDQKTMQQLLEKQGAEYYIVRSVEYVQKALDVNTNSSLPF